MFEFNKKENMNEANSNHKKYFTALSQEFKLR